MENHHFQWVKSTISMAMFNSYFDITRGYGRWWNHWKIPKCHGIGVFSWGCNWWNLGLHRIWKKIEMGKTDESIPERQSSNTSSTKLFPPSRAHPTHLFCKDPCLLETSLKPGTCLKPARSLFATWLKSLWKFWNNRWLGWNLLETCFFCPLKLG